MIKEGYDSLNRRGCDSEHHLVVAKLWLKLGKHNADKSKAASRHNIEGLPILRACYIVLSKDEEQQQSMREVWKVQRQALMDTLKGILDQKQKQQKELVTIKTLGNFETRKKRKDKINNSRANEVRKQANRQNNENR